ncbi:MAG: peptidoglycan editing factor PgeF [Chloroflexia bacterium]|nr:peptidoglycan editing factor PgeF [Chloroflexia bacterium]
MSVSNNTRNVEATLENAMPLQSSMLLEISQIAHGFTRRQLNLGIAEGNVGYGAPRDKLDGWEMRQRWCKSIEVDPDHIVTVHQVHGRQVMQVGFEHGGLGARPESQPAGVADALITDAPELVLMTLHADCLPILIVDPERPAIAAVHSGWRGTVADVVGATVATLVSTYHSRPANLLAVVGPGIGPCCYQVGPEVIDAWRGEMNDQPDRAYRRSANECIFDLWTANQLLLIRAGLRPERIESMAICTRCDGATYFSHRAQGANTGRTAALIALRQVNV